jgi:hypothetical protein
LIGAWTVEQTSYPSWHAAFVFSEDGSMTILDSRDQVWEKQIITDWTENSYRGKIVFVSSSHPMQDILGSTVFAEYEKLEDGNLLLRYYDSELRGILYISFSLIPSKREIVPRFETPLLAGEIERVIVFDFDSRLPDDESFRNGGSLDVLKLPPDIAGLHGEKSESVGLLDIPARGPGMTGEPKASFVAYHTDKLRDTITSFQMYITGDSTIPERTPYVVYSVDISEYTEQDCYIVGKRTVIHSVPAAISSLERTNVWMEGRLDFETPVHVWGWRKNLGSHFTTSNYGRFGDLITVPLDGERTWGDLRLNFVEICAGVSSGTPFMSYIDDIIIGSPKVDVPDDIESSLVAHFREFFEMASLPSGTMIGVLPVFTINGNNFEFAVSVESEASKIAAQEGLQVINREILDDVFRQEKWTAQMTLETDRAIEFGRHLGADAVLTGYILNLDSMLSLFVRIIDVEQAFVVASTQISLPNASPVP